MTREASSRECCDMRCGCGNLLARWVEGGVELKCRRCKRMVIVPIEGANPNEARQQTAD